MSYAAGCTCSLDVALLLWLWCRLAAATPIGPLDWKFPCAMGVALKRQKKKTENLCHLMEHTVHFYLV